MIQVQLPNACRNLDTIRRPRESSSVSLLVVEVRKPDGSRYPPASIHLILCVYSATCDEAIHLLSIYLTRPTSAFDVYMELWKLYSKLCIYYTHTAACMFFTFAFMHRLREHGMQSLRTKAAL